MVVSDRCQSQPGLKKTLCDYSDQGRDRGLILRASADRVDRLHLAVVENSGRKTPIDSSARIDIAAVIAHVRRRLVRIEIDRRAMSVDDIFREPPRVAKEAVAYP